VRMCTSILPCGVCDGHESGVILDGSAFDAYIIDYTERRAVRLTPEDGLLDKLCRLPAPLDTDTDCARLHHFDLDAMSDADLALERRRVERRLEFDRQPIPWLGERLRAVRGAERLRRGTGVGSVRS
jgi:hypothetical protein